MNGENEAESCDVYVPIDQQEESSLLGVVGPPLDDHDILNTIHVPNDADEYEEGLRRILERIPEGWGRWISCDKGWYPLIIELDQKLAEIAPDYELHQVKEKYATLRYYIGFPHLEPQCCIDLEATRPYKGPVDPKWRFREEGTWTAAKQYELDKWHYEVYLPHLDSPEHAANDEALNPERERRSKASKEMYKIIDEYEELSARTCETCGAPAEGMYRHHWYKTLCAAHADEQGYIAIPDENE